jgi:uncharacterized membrane protein YphA (DoxX/SURF4 family)
MAGAAVETAGRPLRAGLWVAQVLVFVVFVWAGFAKLTTPIPDLSKMMAWTGQLPVAFVRTMGLIDLAGGIGILLPALTRIKPGVTTVAALCCSILQVCAIVFHVSRGEAALTPLNFILLALALFVYWGRRKAAPINPR